MFLQVFSSVASIVDRVRLLSGHTATRRRREKASVLNGPDGPSAHYSLPGLAPLPGLLAASVRRASQMGLSAQDERLSNYRMCDCE